MSTEKKQNSNGLFIPNRQLSFVVSGFLSLGAAIFIGGYFFGKQHVVEPFVAKAENDSFADQVYVSLCALYDADVAELAGQIGDQELLDGFELAREEAQDDDVVQESEIKSIAQLPEQLPNQEEEKRWYAQLIGYGQEKSAQEFAQKLQKNGIPVSVATRVSTTSKGRKRTWYQVVTDSYSDRHALQLAVDKIVQDEKLKGVQISSC